MATSAGSYCDRHRCPHLPVYHCFTCHENLCKTHGEECEGGGHRVTKQVKKAINEPDVVVADSQAKVRFGTPVNPSTGSIHLPPDADDEEEEG